MSHGSDPTELPPAKSPRPLGPITIDSLGEDILLEIFLHLPSLATLVRAALTCRLWRRAVASSPAFRRRFRELHRAPLLGLVAEPQRDALPAFAPAQHRDRDVLAAISGSDFALTALLDPQGYAADVPLHWCIQDCCDGYLLLANWDAGLLAAVNPLGRYGTEYIDMPVSFSFDKERTDVPVALDCHLLSSDEDPMSKCRSNLFGFFIANPMFKRWSSRQTPGIGFFTLGWTSRRGHCRMMPTDIGFSLGCDQMTLCTGEHAEAGHNNNGVLCF